MLYILIMRREAFRSCYWIDSFGRYLGSSHNSIILTSISRTDCNDGRAATRNELNFLLPTLNDILGKSNMVSFRQTSAWANDGRPNTTRFPSSMLSAASRTRKDPPSTWWKRLIGGATRVAPEDAIRVIPAIGRSSRRRPSLIVWKRVLGCPSRPRDVLSRVDISSTPSFCCYSQCCLSHEKSCIDMR
jgi:hypothetical protein